MPQCAQRTMDSLLPRVRGARRVGSGGVFLRALFCEMMRAMIMPANMITTQNNALPNCSSLQNHFQHETAACVGQEQEGKARQGPAQGDAATPPVLFSSP